MRSWLVLALPELTLSALALLLLAVDVLAVKRVKAWALAISIAGLMAALVMVLTPPMTGRSFGMLAHDDFSMFFKALAILSAILILFLSEKDEVLMGKGCGTYAALIVLSTLGVLFLSSAEDLLILFVGLELTTVPLFILAGYLRRDPKSSESAVKFLLVGAFSTGLMVFGMSYLYGITGSTSFAGLRDWLAQAALAGWDLTLFIVGAFFLLAGLGFKMSLVPFHQWTPDVYHGAPTPITAFFSVSREAGVIAVLLRLFGAFISPSLVQFAPLFWLLSALTMTVGNVTALRQENLKRLLAYSSIAHAGTIFIGLAAGTEMGRQGVMLYSFAYSLMSIGAFAVVIAVSRAKKSDGIEAIQGLAKENLPLALLMAFFLMSLAGIPPFLGFLGKFYVFMAAVEQRMFWLVGIALINALAAVYYYFRIVHRMFFMEPVLGGPVPAKGFSLGAAALASVSALFFLGLFPQQLVAWIGAHFRFLP